MSNVRITWDLPQVGPNQAPLEEARVEGRVVGGPATFTSLGNPVAAIDPQEILLQDVAPGDWVYRVVIVDKQGQTDLNPTAVSATVPFDPPGSATNIQVTIE